MSPRTMTTRWPSFLENAPQVDLLEVCCPSNSGLASMMEKRGGSSARIGLHNYDLGAKDGLRGALDMADQLHPQFMWISTPCGPFSPIQTLFNERSEEQRRRSMQRQKKGRKLIKAGVEMAYRQTNEAVILDGSGRPTTKGGMSRRSRSFYSSWPSEESCVRRCLMGAWLGSRLLTRESQCGNNGGL